MVREMRPEDWSRVADIYGQGIALGNCTFTREVPEYEDWDRDHLKTCRYVYELDGQVVGFIVAAPTSKREPYRGVVELSVFVDGSCRHRGIGTALMERMIAETEARGYWSLYAVILAHNAASIGLHKKCGFRVIGYREAVAKDRFDNWCNTVLMERRNGIR